MEQSLDSKGRELHAAALDLFGDFLLSLVPAEKARIENLRGNISVDVRLHVNDASVSFLHCTADGAREALGSLALPRLPCDGSCIEFGYLCAECDKSGEPGVTLEQLAGANAEPTP